MTSSVQVECGRDEPRTRLISVGDDLLQLLLKQANCTKVYEASTDESSLLRYEESMCSDAAVLQIS